MKKKRNFKKVLGVVGLLAVAVPATLTVVACGTRVEVKKIELSTLITKRTIAAILSIDEVVAAVLKANENPKGLSASDLKAENFKIPGYNAEGSVTIFAKSESKYTGSVDIKIEKLAKIDLREVLSVDKKLASDTTEVNVIANVLKLNGSPAGLSASDLKAENFKTPGYNAEGSVTIVAKSESKYTGSVDIKIEKLAKIDLREVLSADKKLASDTTEVNVIANVLKLNGSPAGLSASDLKAENFKTPGYNAEGSVTIVAKSESKYTGSVDIKIEKLAKIELSFVIKNTVVEGRIANDSSTVLAEVIRLNDNVITKEDVNINILNKANKKSDGLAEITAKSESKYTGSVYITIKAFPSENPDISIAQFAFENVTFNAGLAPITSLEGWKEDSFDRYFKKDNSSDSILSKIWAIVNNNNPNAEESDVKDVANYEVGKVFLDRSCTKEDTDNDVKNKVDLYIQVQGMNVLTGQIILHFSFDL